MTSFLCCVDISNLCRDKPCLMSPGAFRSASSDLQWSSWLFKEMVSPQLHGKYPCRYQHFLAATCDGVKMSRFSFCSRLILVL